MDFPKIIVFVTYCLAITWATSPHMVCKTIDVVSAGEDTPDSDLLSVIGPKGQKGEPGSRGSPSRVSQDDMENVVEETVNLAISILEVDTEILKQEVKDLDDRPTVQNGSRAGQESECDGFIYRNKCYFTVVQPKRGVIFDEAKRMCIRAGANLADILNLEHQDLVQDLMRRHLRETWFQVWLGMTYRASERTFHFTTGEIMNPEDYRWYDGWPINNSSPFDNLLIEARRPPRKAVLFNQIPSFQNSNGALCMK